MAKNEKSVEMNREKTVFETIIIGAGISGLACARKLHENKREFLVISEDIGGRILTSEDGKVNYGAYFIQDNCPHIKRFSKKIRKYKFAKMCYHDKDTSYNFWNIDLIIYLPQLIKLIYLVYKFNKHLETYRRKCESISQKQALNSDPFLFKLYNQKIVDFIAEHNIKEFAEIFFKKVAQAFYFLPLNKIDTMHTLLSLGPIVLPSYEFIFQKDKMIKDFKKDILIDTVIKIVKEDHYIIKTKKNSFCAKNVVVATPIHVSKELLNLKKIKKPTSMHVLHVSGRIRERWRSKDYHWFSEEEPLYVLGNQRDGTYLMYLKEQNTNLGKYFYEYKIIAHKFWNPAFNPGGSVLLECEQDENLYMIGDYNLMNMEDAYITGLYAANQIIKGE